MISLSEARAIIAETVRPLDPVYAGLAEIRGRILRQEIQASEDIPAFDRSAMDGYAIASDDDSEKFAVVAEIQPGAMPAVRLEKGQCARIFTGAAVPAGATQVLMQEVTRRDGDWMIPLERPSAPNIRRRGEDAEAGSILLRSGQCFGAGEAALLAQTGVTQVLVSARARVLHITTGNEIVPPDQTPRPGQIRDSNSTLLSALLESCSAGSITHKHCRDQFEELVESIGTEPQAQWDLLLISGGASVGDYDFGARALDELGFKLHFRKINLRPGKPLVFGTRGTQVAFVIPGNPVSHFVTFHLAVRLALGCLHGEPQQWPLAKCVLGAALPGGGDGRETWCPARLSFEGEVKAYPIHWQSSGDSCGLVGANALLKVPGGDREQAAGESVQCLWLEVHA